MEWKMFIDNKIRKIRKICKAKYVNQTFVNASVNRCFYFQLHLQYIYDRIVATE